MKIVMIASPLVAVPPKKYGGAERVIHYLIKGLVEKGHDVTLLASGDSDEPCNIIPICKEHLNFGDTLEEHKKILKEVKKIEAKVKTIIKRLLPNVDIIHSHRFDLKDFQNFPNLTTLHDAFVMSKLRYFENRSGLFYVSVSANQQEAFPDLQYVGVCYNGLDPKEYSFVSKPEDYLCFIGRFDEAKRPHLAIELALKLGMKIKIAGKTDWYGSDYFDKLIRPHLNNPLVEYLGEIGFEKKLELISKARVNLHPTGWREPFGLTILESAYCGTPTMAIAQGALPELIEDHRTGLLVEDFVEGYHHIPELLNMDRKYTSERARHLFNYKTMTRQYEIAYQKVIEIFEERNKLSQKTMKEMETTRNILKGVWKEQKS